MAALAAGSGSNGEGVSGIAGNARLLIVQAGGADGSFSDVEEAAAIVYAVDHGARILNLSLGGPSTSTAERRAIDYAVAKGALLVAAVGNNYASGNPVEYPAALLQPPVRVVSEEGALPWGPRPARERVRPSRARVRISRSPHPARGLQRRLRLLACIPVSARDGSRFRRGPLRLRQRHLLRGAAGGGSRSARVGCQPSCEPNESRRSSSRRPLATGAGTRSSATACSTSPRRLLARRFRATRGRTRAPRQRAPSSRRRRSSYASVRSMRAPRLRRRSSMRS